MGARLRRVLWVLVCVVPFSGCSCGTSDPADLEPLPDAGRTGDGSAGVDAGPGIDGGPGVDAGPGFDAGPTPSGCGDGALDLASGEECDDGNTAGGDGCDAACQLEPVGATCGDGTMDAYEVCDDGNTTNGDGCSPTCNFTGTTTAFVGSSGMPGRMDGVGSAARIRSLGTLAADDAYVWFAETGDGMAMPPVPAALRRIEVATATITTVATLPVPGAEGIATNGTDTIWIAAGDAAGPAIYSIGRLPPHAVARVTGSASCNGVGCYADGPPGTATFGGIRGLTWYGGHLWIVDPEAATIRRFDPATGDVVTVAGDPYQRAVVDGVGSGARFNSPRYLVSDGTGLLYVSDTNGASIRTLDTATMAVTTFAGDGTVGYVDAVGSAARIHRPRGITTDGTSIYFAEFNAHTIRQGVIASQSVSTLVGAPMSPGYVEGVGSGARLDSPWGLAFHYPSNSLFFVDASQVIRRIQ